MSKCARGKTYEVVVSNRRVGVYERRGRFYGCSKRTGRRTRLRRPDGAGLDTYSLVQFQLAGDHVAYVLRRHEYRGRDSDGAFSDQIIVRDLRRGRPVRYEGHDRRGPYVEVKQPGVSDLVVDRRGRVAWIVRNPYGNPVQVEVYKQDSHGRALLDSGDGIDRASLQLRDGQLSWTNGGSTRTAPLN